MIKKFYPNPIVVQRLQAGPLSAHIDVFVQQLFDEGYALWTAKYAVRLLADLATWMQQQGLTLTELAERPVNTFFQHRYQNRRPHRDDQALLKKLLAHLRAAGVIAAVFIVPHSACASAKNINLFLDVTLNASATQSWIKILIPKRNGSSWQS